MSWNVDSRAAPPGLYVPAATQTWSPACTWESASCKRWWAVAHEAPLPPGGAAARVQGPGKGRRDEALLVRPTGYRNTGCFDVVRGGDAGARHGLGPAASSRRNDGRSEEYGDPRAYQRGAVHAATAPVARTG